jgi:hypothetical protein
MGAPNRLIVIVAAVASIAVYPAPGQDAKPASGAKSTKPGKEKKATKAIPPVTFQAHNEGSAEGAIYGEENLVTLTIDSTGIQYKSKTMEKPVSILWAQVAGWQPNNFTSRSPSRPDGGDFGIGIYQGAQYLSFRTRNGRDYTAAIKALRALAALKERPGIG